MTFQRRIERPFRSVRLIEADLKFPGESMNGSCARQPEIGGFAPTAAKRRKPTWQHRRLIAAALLVFDGKISDLAAARCDCEVGRLASATLGKMDGLRPFAAINFNVRYPKN